MRILAAIVLLSLAAPSAGAQDWTTLPLGTSSDLRAIEKTSFSQRYVVGDGGVRLERVEPFDAAYHAAISEGLEEWASPEDDEAFGDL